jgi:indolepyruvate decarboxylase
MHASKTIGDHLLSRLAEIGIHHLFGVPGDYNLAFLDQVIAHPAIRWVGNANELNAAYAADGYARVNGAGALLTTFGVGELSAMNGLAGSYAERVPVLHIVGAPSASTQQARLLMHHSYCDGDFERFMSAGREVTVAQTHLTLANAVDEIDRVLTQMLRERRPGYIMLPTDVARGSLATAPRRFRTVEPRASQRDVEAFADSVGQLLQVADSAVVLADFLADRFQCCSQLQELVDTVPLSYATLSMGKGVLEESAQGFLGIYAGGASEPAVKMAIESAGAVISVGVVFADVLTAGFSHQIDPTRLIDIQPFEATVAGRRFGDLPMGRALAIVSEQVRRQKLQSPAAGQLACIKPVDHREERLSQAAFWSMMQAYLRADDVVVADQGTSFYGSVALRLPLGARFIGQPLWASIGYGLPAAFGIQTRLPERRVIVFVGDGSALLTAQEIGSMLRDDMKPVIFLLNNCGYTVERAINGPEQRYNDIALWDWTLIPKAMGHDKASVSLRVDTIGELADALVQAESTDHLTLIEVILPKADLPPLLQATCEAITVRNSA